MDGNTQPLLAYNVWMSLSRETRAELARTFNIPRTGEVVVRSMGLIDGNIGGEVQSDGYRPQDLYAITVPKMQEFTGSDSNDFYKLFDQTLNIVDPPIVITEGLEVAPKEIIVIDEVGEVTEEMYEKLLTWPKFMQKKKKEGLSMDIIKGLWARYKLDNNK